MTTQNAKHFNIKFEQLGFEAQEHVLDTIVAVLLERAKPEGEGYLNNDWHAPKPRTWQEAYVRTYEIDYILWETPAEIAEFNFEDALNEELRRQAEIIAKKHFSQTEIEVVI